ncbi:MAG: HYR domain-containing protein [Opitutae bacterium]|nr:HYR domain-containing protein [Opitutae bacterium]
MPTRMLRALAAFLFAATLAYSADTVELLPGKITGSITLTSDTINSGSVSASAIDGSGSASSSFNGNTFSIVVPAGKTWRLSFNVALATSNGSYAQFSVNTAENVSVGANQTVAQNYSLATAHVSADVQVAHGTLSSVGTLQAYGNDGSVNFSSYSQSTGVVTVLPMHGVTVYGTASLQSTEGQSSTVALPSTSVDVPVSGASVTWNVDAAFVSSTVQGTLLLSGGPALNSAQISLYGSNAYYSTSLSGNGAFQFTNLQAGNYSAYAYANFPNSSLYLYRNFDLAADSVATVDFKHDLATAKMGLSLTGFLSADKVSSGYLYGNGPDNASGYASLNAGSFSPVVTAGTWSFSQISLANYASDGYFSITNYAPNRAQTTFAAGDNVTLPAFQLNTTQTEFTFDVVEPAGATSETLISYPNIWGYAYKYSPSGEWLGYTSVNAQFYGAAQAKPRVRVVGEPGTYTLQAYGYVDGSNVSFGSFTIELKAPLPTPVGTDVVVAPGAGVTLEFDHVTTEGVTTVSQLPVGPALPGGYSNLTSNGAKVYYSASTTATFDGYIDVTVGYDASTIPPELEGALHLFYYDKPTETWIDITTGVDAVNNTISGTAPGLSTFAIGLPHGPTIGTITAPVGGLTETELTFTASFSDPDPGEHHTAVWSWGSGLGNSAGVVDESTGTITGTHTFVAGGTYTGTLTLTDITGNVVTKTFTFTVTGNVVDNTAPVIAISGDLTAEATSPAGAPVNFTATATDDTDGSVSVTLSSASGSIFPLGTTTVTATATDAAGNVATKTFTVTVADTTAPVLTVPANITLEATSAAGASATFAATATDATGAALSYSAASGSTFPLGTTTVNVTATDAAGNASTGHFTVTVRDTKAPVITSVTTNAPALWPPNHKMVAVTVSASATDAGGAVTYRIVSVTSSEPDNGLGDGDTANDIAVTGAMTVNLRAERSGNGNGRTYTITVEAKDAAGNTSTSTVAVVVPKNQSGK